MQDCNQESASHRSDAAGGRVDGDIGQFGGFPRAEPAFEMRDGVMVVWDSTEEVEGLAPRDAFARRNRAKAGVPSRESAFALLCAFCEGNKRNQAVLLP